MITRGCSRDWACWLISSFQTLTNPTPNYPEILKQTALAKVDAAYSGLLSALSPLIADLGTAAAVAGNATNLVKSVGTDLKALQGDITDQKLALDQYRNRCTAIVQRCQSDVNVVLDDVRQFLQALNLLLGVNISSDVSTQIAVLQAEPRSQGSAVARAGRPIGHERDAQSSLEELHNKPRRLPRNRPGEQCVRRIGSSGKVQRVRATERAAPGQTSPRLGAWLCRGCGCRPNALPSGRGSSEPVRETQNAAPSVALTLHDRRPFR